MEKKLILFVDDDEAVLEELQYQMISKASEWEMYFAKSGREALSLLKDFTFDAVVADEGMPVIEGSELLSEIMNHHPECMRFILSERSNENVLLNSSRCAHQIIPKPFDQETLKRPLARAFALRDLLRSEKLKSLAGRMRVIPSLPEIYYELLEELRSPDTSSARVGRILEKDIGMTAKVLQLVNSAFFGLATKVTDPVQATIYLGLNTIKSLVLVAHVFSTLDEAKVLGFSAQKLLHHSLAVGRGAQAISKTVAFDVSLTEDAFMAGLFHDIGKLVLAANLPQLYVEAVKQQVQRGCTLIESEMNLFGSSHAEVGAYILALWGFGDSVVEACAFHHVPSKTDENSFCPLAAVHVANSVHNESFPPQPGARLEAIDSAFLAHLGHDQKLQDWKKLCSDAYLKQDYSDDEIIR